MKLFSRVALVCVFLIASVAGGFAKDLGIEFNKMPRGTTAHYVDSKGLKFTWTYKGKAGDWYLIQVSGSQNYQRLYNSDGFLVKTRQLDSQVNFRPYYCERKLGRCQFFFDSRYSKFSGRWNGNLYKTKEGYAFEIASVNKNKADQGGTFFMKYGKYNLLTEFVAGDSWFRLVKMTAGN